MSREPMVLARFPRIGSSSSSNPRHQKPVSYGRLIGQSLSFRLLAAAAVILVAIAVNPFSLGSKNNQETDIAANAVPLPQWDPQPSASVAEASVAEASVPATIPETTIPEAAPQAAPATASTSSATQIPSMSTWPNPEHPVSSSPEASNVSSQRGVNSLMATRPTEYQ